MKIHYLLAIFIFASCNFEPKQPTINEPSAETKDTVNSGALLNKEAISLPIFDYDTSLWIDIALLDTSILLDIKYATSDNFVKEKMYECGRCFLRPEVAKRIVLIQKDLQKQGYGLKMLDCFRPRPIQWKLWKKVPDPRYVSDPRKGSMHNRGAAVDLTLTDANGNELDMGTPYDFFGERAYSTFTNLPDSILQRRNLLNSVMEAQGFQPIRTEWWHFSWKGKNYPLSDMLWECN